MRLGKSIDRVSSYEPTYDLLGASRQRMTAPTTSHGSGVGRAMYTSQGAGMRSYAPKTL